MCASWIETASVTLSGRWTRSRAGVNPEFAPLARCRVRDARTSDASGVPARR
jgi:hypothetical protein